MKSKSLSCQRGFPSKMSCTTLPTKYGNGIKHGFPLEDFTKAYGRKILLLVCKLVDAQEASWY